MKKLILLSLLASSVYADDDIIATTINEDGSTNAWTATDLTDALGLINRRYHRDMLTPEGRKQWHGKVVYQEVNTETLEKKQIYEDGYIYIESPRRNATPPKPADDLELTERRKAIISARDYVLPVKDEGENAGKDEVK